MQAVKNPLSYNSNMTSSTEGAPVTQATDSNGTN